MKKILIIDHFSQTPDEPGNNRFIYIASLLCEMGYEVEIVTTDFSHKAKCTRKPMDEELCKLPYKFTMLKEPGYKKNVSLKRFRSHGVFGKNLKKYLAQIEKPDLVYVAVPSLDVGATAAKYCKKNNIPYVVDIQDLWPEAFKLVLTLPVISDIVFAPLTVKANKTYKQADRIIAVSETYKNRGIKSCQKDKEGLCVYLGTDLGTFDKAAAEAKVEKPQGEIWVAYVGTLGHSYNIEIIIEALSRLDEELRKNVVFKVLGDGPYLERFKEYAAERNARVEFLGRMGYGDMVGYLSHADIAVNPIVKGAAQSIINKHGDYAASGLPVVNTQECEEYRALMTDYKCGINCQVDSVQEVAEALEMLIKDENLRTEMGKNSRKLAEERFDRRYTNKLIIAEIEKLLR